MVAELFLYISDKQEDPESDAHTGLMQKDKLAEDLKERPTAAANFLPSQSSLLPVTACQSAEGSRDLPHAKKYHKMMVECNRTWNMWPTFVIMVINKDESLRFAVVTLT